MTQTPVINPIDTKSYPPPLGAHPRIWGSAEPNYSVEIVDASRTSTVYGKGVAGPSGDWVSDLTVPVGKVLYVKARCFVSPGDSTTSAWSNSIEIRS